MTLRLRLALLMLAGVLLYSAGRQLVRAVAQTPPGTAIDVHVQYAIAGGVPPSAGGSDSTASGPIASGVSVLVVPAGDASVSPVAAGVTNDNGCVELQLPPGQYWVYIPYDPAAQGIISAAMLSRLPDDTVVLAWGSVDLPDDGPIALTLTITIAAP